MLIWLTLLFIIFIVGFAFAWLLRSFQIKSSQEIAKEIYAKSEEQRAKDISDLLGNIEDRFGKLSLEALSKSSEELIKLAKTKLESEREIGAKELESKKILIDHQLGNISKELENVTKLVGELEKDRAQKYGGIESQLIKTGEQTASLIDTTNKLREALANTKVRGQWGERMAEDVLKLAGFIENVNYRKQKTILGVGSRPDFTFMLPRDLKLNMDVKFPLENYMKYLETDSPTDKAKHKTDFLKDVRLKIKEVTSREYINPEQQTVDYVLLFIPNEQIYSFIHQEDSLLLDDAIKQKVIICSPMTLFAVLAVIRQAVENFNLERTSHEIISLFGTFKKQWEEFVRQLLELGKKIEGAQKEFDKLTTTRKRLLEKPLNKIEELRSQYQLPIAEIDETEVLPLTDDSDSDMPF